jgi:hypothetical protein
METVSIAMTSKSISKSLEKSMSYSDYRNLVAQLVEQNSTTGADKTEALANYTMLNDKRMKRWDKTVKVSPEAASKIKNYSKKITWLVISESWCGDAAHILPVINKVAELNPNISFNLVLRDENLELMDAFLTNGGRSIPKLVMIDDASQKVLNTFGPRPTIVTEMVENYKALHGTLTSEFKEELQHWYNKDKGQSTIEDLLNLLD